MRALPPLRSWALPRSVLGFGASGGPFFRSAKLVHETLAPLVPPRVCAAIRSAASAYMSKGGSSSFTMTDTNRDADVHALPRTHRWLRTAFISRIAPLAVECYGRALGSTAELHVYRALVVQYDAAAGFISHLQNPNLIV